MVDRIALLFEGLEHFQAEALAVEWPAERGSRDAAERFFRRIADLVHYIASTPELREPFTDLLEYSTRLHGSAEMARRREEVTVGLQNLSKDLQATQTWDQFQKAT